MRGSAKLSHPAYMAFVYRVALAASDVTQLRVYSINGVDSFKFEVGEAKYEYSKRQLSPHSSESQSNLPHI